MSTTRAHSKRAKVSVIIVNKDELQIQRSLELLKPQCEALGAECLVLDASTKRLDFIRLANPWVTWIDYEPPFWRSSTIPLQRNVAVRASQGEVIAFCDAGGEPDSNWLSSLTDSLLSGAADFVAGPIRSLGKGAYGVVNDLPDGEVVEWPPTANLGFTRKLFDSIGGFDERYFYTSDIDFAIRSKSAGFVCRSVQAAGMAMNWGPLRLNSRRSWRYGRGWLRLMSYHPSKRWWLIKHSPYRVVYAAWVLAAPIALFAPVIDAYGLVFTALWLSFPPVMIINNRKLPSPASAFIDHVIGGAAVLVGALKLAVGELEPMRLVPRDESPYIQGLQSALGEIGIPVVQSHQLTPSHSLNVLLEPLRLIGARLRGNRIIHIHWTYPFRLPGGKFGRGFAQIWFYIYIITARANGLKIVWTMHNRLPHERVFLNDLKAQKFLASRAMGIIALTESSAQIIASQYLRKDVEVIPHPAILLPIPSANKIQNQTLKAPSEQKVFSTFGLLRKYKNVEMLINIAGQVSGSAKIRIAGLPSPEYGDLLARHINSAKLAGGNVEAKFAYLSEQELADFLDSSDFAVFTFHEITNSGSVMTALATGLPCIIPNHQSLNQIPTSAVIRFDLEKGENGLREALLSAASMTELEYQAMSDAAQKFAKEYSWLEVARSHNSLFRRLIRA